MDLALVSDDALFGRVESLARTERFSMVDLLVHLGELDSRPACLLEPDSPPLREATQPREKRVIFNFAASEEVRAWFDAARDLLRHRFPSGAMEEVIGEALRRLVEQELPRPSTRRREPPHDAASRRRIPKRVEAEVWRRDGGRCAFIGFEGLRCGSTAWLELDHVVPWALGGRSDDPENVRLLCRAHNQSEARRVFGTRATRPAGA